MECYNDSTFTPFKQPARTAPPVLIWSHPMPIKTTRSVPSKGTHWALALAVAFLPAAAFAETRDPKAVELAQGVLEAMGGQQAWDETPDSVFTSPEPVAAE